MCLNGVDVDEWPSRALPLLALGLRKACKLLWHPYKSRYHPMDNYHVWNNCGNWVCLVEHADEAVAWGLHDLQFIHQIARTDRTNHPYTRQLWTLPGSWMKLRLRFIHRAQYGPPSGGNVIPIQQLQS